MTLSTPTLSGQQRRKKTERPLGIFALLSFIVAWIIGDQLENADVEPYLHEAMPESGHIKPFFDKSCLAPFQLGEDIDGVTSATYTSRAATSALEGSRSSAANQLDLRVPLSPKPKSPSVFLRSP